VHKKGWNFTDSGFYDKENGVDYKNVGKDLESQRWKVILRGLCKRNKKIPAGIEYISIKTPNLVC